jgi:predicted O-methyltransferase YrrM
MGLGLGLRAKFFRVRSEIRYFVSNTIGRPNLYDLNSPERVGCVYRVPTDMCATDRLMIYALVRGLRPRFALEIGARWGGSARIITNAMEENGIGFLVGIDPEIRNFRASQADLHGRYKLVQGYSPEAIAEAVRHLDGKLDFVFIDALHIYDAVLKDFRGVLPYLAPDAHVLFHDTYHQGIDAAIREVMAENPGLVDCGFITRSTVVAAPVSGQGLRLIRNGQVDSERLISEAYERHNQTPPPFTKDLWNYDEYYEKILKPKARDRVT